MSRLIASHELPPLVPLSRDCYSRPAVDVARNLLGACLVRELDGQLLVGKITETEAYGGHDDSASHAYRGRTSRNAPMFGPPGHAYLYLIYGLHEMFNIVTGPDGEAGAVLIRALEPVHGEDLMSVHRGSKPRAQLANGPGKLARALALTRAEHNTHDLCQGARLWLTPGQVPEGHQVVSGPRVGIDYALPEDRDAPRRFRLAPL